MCWGNQKRLDIRNIILLKISGKILLENLAYKKRIIYNKIVMLDAKEDKNGKLQILHAAYVGRMLNEIIA